MTYIRIFLLCFALPILLPLATGCCRVHRSTARDKIKSKSQTVKKSSKKSQNYLPVKKRYYSGKKLTETQIRLTKVYKELEDAQSMMERNNTEGALRAVRRVQYSVTNNPYIDMQAWYLTMKIYDKEGKRSSRKRAMRKMIESLKKLQKDPAYLKSYKDGMMCQQLIGIVLKKEKGKYEF